jgi:hypothetical protein
VLIHTFKPLKEKFFSWQKFYFLVCF